MHGMFMRRCLELAERGRRKVGNGAMVGAVLVRQGKIIVEGWHEGFGKPHAERMLLDNFKEKIEPDDILYINLEPCSEHATKKTPGCVEQIIQRGVRNVVIGMRDPDARVSGSSILALERAEVEFSVGVLRAECEYFNRGYISLRTKNRPWITLKMARTADGAISNRDGSPMRITSTEQDIWSHTFLRAKHDAILVGIGTVLKDNPKLTPRLNTKNDQTLPLPFRLILDSGLKIALDASVVSDENLHRTIIITKETKEFEGTKEILTTRGVRIFECSLNAEGNFVWDDLWKLLTTPDGDFHGIASILVEGGAKSWQFFRRAGMFDCDVVFIG